MVKVEVDYDKIAEKIIKDALQVKENQVVLMTGGLHQFPLLEAMSLKTMQLGAFPEVRIVSNCDFTRRLYEEVPLEYFARFPSHQMKWIEDIDSQVKFDTTIDPRKSASVPRNVTEAAKKASLPHQKRIEERKIRSLAVAYPTEETASFYNQSYEDFARLIWESMLVDFDLLKKDGEQIKEIMEQSNGQIHLTSDKGSDLTFSIAGRPVLIDDGILSDEDVSKSHCIGNLPPGEVYIAPLEDTTEGKVVFDFAFDKGKKIEDLTLEFKQGRIVSFHAKTNEDIFREVLEHASGDKDKVGELGIGLNPRVTEPTGYICTDEKIRGTVHLAIGNNTYYCGNNKSTIHWDMVIMKPTLKCGDAYIIREGKLGA